MQLKTLVRILAAVFGGAFFIGLMAMGDLLGSSADSTRAYTEQFDSATSRIEHFVGALALFLAALMILATGLAIRKLSSPNAADLTPDFVAGLGGLSAAGIMVAAGLLVAPSLMRTIGEFTDDPGIEANAAAGIAQAGTAVFVITLLVIGIMTVLTFRLAAREWAIGRWVQITGGIVAVLTVAGYSVVAAFPMGLWWIAFGFRLHTNRTVNKSPEA